MNRASRTARGLCIECPAQTVGHRRCESCRAKQVDRNRLRSERLHGEGKCARCAKLNDRLPLLYCDACWQKQKFRKAVAA